MKIELVVFDMAGTTVYDGDAVNLCLRGALEAANVPVSRDEVNSVMGIAKPIAIRTLLERRSDDPATVSETEVLRIHDDFLQRMIAHYRFDPSVREMDGASATFRKLREAGIKVALDTGFSRPIADILFARLGWQQGGLIDASVTSDEVEKGRPYPDMIYRAMERTGVTDVRRVAKVGDTPADLQEGQAAGCGLVIGVTNGSHTREELAPFPHTHLLASIAELPGLLV